MIELPEAVAIARQLNREILGKRISSASGGSSPHKWAFYTPPGGNWRRSCPAGPSERRALFVVESTYR